MLVCLFAFLLTFHYPWFLKSNVVIFSAYCQIRSPKVVIDPHFEFDYPLTMLSIRLIKKAYHTEIHNQITIQKYKWILKLGHMLLYLVYIALYLVILAPIHHIRVTMLKFYDPFKVIKHLHNKEFTWTTTRLVTVLNEGLQSDDISTNCTLFGKGVVIGENGENNQNVKWK